MLITKSPKISSIAFASIVRHTYSMSTRLSTSNHIRLKLLTDHNFTMISVKTIQTATFIDAIAFSTVHAWDYTFGCKRNLVLVEIETSLCCLLTKLTSWTVKAFGTLAFILLNTFTAIQTFWFTDAYRRNNLHCVK